MPSTTVRSLFTDRTDAGRRLAQRLVALRDADVVVLGLPRGGVPVAAPVAAYLNAPLDVVLVRKVGIPSQPGIAMGAVGEGGVLVVDEDTVSHARVAPDALDHAVRHARQELDFAAHLRGVHAPLPLEGKVAVIVDDGLATGATARAACQAAKARGATRLVVAVPIAPPGWRWLLHDHADELICLTCPSQFHAVAEAYADFTPTGDEAVLAALTTP